MVAFYLILGVNTSHVNAQHFNYNEAYQILQGSWVDTEKGKRAVFVWKSKDGSECNIINGKGYTDANGNSLIYFDYKGVTAKIAVTYYPDQGRYYAEMSTWRSNTGVWNTEYYSLTKE
jgi:homoserine trans-succinylase